MNKIKPFLHKGTRDFLPEEVDKRNFIFETIKFYFHLYGFVPIETPAIERLEILTGKYGEEGDKLLFKILNSGEYAQKVDWEKVKGEDSSILSKKMTSFISEKGLRYDLTVPLARYVVMNQNELVFPFRRFHIGPVWRADRPGKGRFQEFYQCDADIIGTTSLYCELDLVWMILDVFKALGLNITLRLNNRKILEGIANTFDFREQMNQVIVIIDKLDKIGMEGVVEELTKTTTLKPDTIDRLIRVLKINDLNQLQQEIGSDPTGQKGIEEMQFIFDKIKSNQVVFDVTLARGLDYYTGCIFEAVSNDMAMGSILGGGRYDNLTEVFGGKDMSGVGISFGIERIYEIMKECHLFPNNQSHVTKVLISHIEKEAEKIALNLMHQLRAAGIATELYPAMSKPDKQLKYANGKKIAYVVIIGSQELQEGVVTLKNMQTGEQEKLNVNDIIQKVK